MHPTISWRGTNGLLILVLVLLYLNVARSTSESDTATDSGAEEVTASGEATDSTTETTRSTRKPKSTTATDATENSESGEAADSTATTRSTRKPKSTTTTRSTRRPKSTTTTDVTENSESGEAADSTATTRSTKVTKSKKTTKKSSSGRDYSNYGQDFAGYGDDDNSGDDNYDTYDRYDNEKPGKRGRSPSRFGQDMADDKKVYDDKDSMMASLDVWITSVNNWEDQGKSKYRGRERGNNYKKKKNYNDKDNQRKDDDNDDDDKEKDYDKKDKNRNKRSYQRVRFPCRQYQNIRRFPLRRFPPLFSVFPWIPIFYDRITYQTFIFSPTGGIYVLPPLINFYGQRFAVAQLIQWGYASLVSTGASPPPDFNVAPLVQPAIADSGSSYGPPLGFNPNNGQFNGGVTTNFASFRPRSAEIVREDYENASGSDNVESARQQVNV